jgi:tetratricopeptide (TPR) repeat protein
LGIAHSEYFRSRLSAIRALFALAVVSAQVTAAQPAKSTPFDRFFDADRLAGMNTDGVEGRAALDAARLRAAPCTPDREDPASYVACLFDALGRDDRLEAISEPSPLAASTVTSVFRERKGNCAALVAAILAIEPSPNQLEAVVFPSHVMLGVRHWGGSFYETLKGGQPGSPPNTPGGAGLPPAHPVHVRGRDFLPYYLDNLAVRAATDRDDLRAERLFRAALADSHRNSRVHCNYGTFLLERGRIAEAVEELRRAVRDDSKNADAWANLGVAFAKTEDRDRARTCFERALRADPGHRIAAENLWALDTLRPPPQP